MNRYAKVIASLLAPISIALNQYPHINWMVMIGAMVSVLAVYFVPNTTATKVIPAAQVVVPKVEE